MTSTNEVVGSFNFMDRDPSYHFSSPCSYEREFARRKHCSAARVMDDITEGYCWITVHCFTRFFCGIDVGFTNASLSQFLTLFPAVLISYLSLEIGSFIDNQEVRSRVLILI